MKMFVGYRKIIMVLIVSATNIAGAALEAPGAFYGVLGTITTLALAANGVEHMSKNSHVTMDSMAHKAA